MSNSLANELPATLRWLKDAPLFADSDQIARFYDAVVSPESRQKSISIEITDEKVKAVKGKLNLEASLSPGKLAVLLAPWFAIVNPTLKAAGEGEGSTEITDGHKTVIELEPISTPQRQLKQLALYYLLNHTARLALAGSTRESDWRKSSFITETPRALLFLSLPGASDAVERKLPTTKLIPMAAEFANGPVVLLYEELDFGAGKPDAYPPKEYDREQRDIWWRNYWKWFDTNFKSHKAMIAIENAATKHGRIRWIDYRLPLTSEGETLHLHVCPGTIYDTGVFAYNLVQRGHTHGIRLVGALKSGPDLNVLAIYER